MKSKILTLFILVLFFGGLAQVLAQTEKKPQPAAAKAPLPMYQLAEQMAQRLNSSLQVKTVVGEPIKVGRVTLLPIMMIDIGFGGGGGGMPQNLDMGGKGFYMSGEVRPLGFVVATKTGTKFVSVGKIPRQ